MEILLEIKIKAWSLTFYRSEKGEGSIKDCDKQWPLVKQENLENMGSRKTAREIFQGGKILLTEPNIMRENKRAEH